jgi:hypothetical protein
MAENKGFIKIYRAILDNPVTCKDADHLAVWIYLLLEATHKERDKLFDGKKVTLEPGQLITGRKVIADKFNISESKARRVLDAFESDRQIDRQRGAKSSVISIVNWNKYQSSDRQNGQQVTGSRPASDRQPTTLQECKEPKNVKNERTNIYAELPPALVSALIDFEEMRKKKRNPMTDRARELLLKKLNKLSGGDVEECIALLEESTEKGWASVYPKKQEKGEDRTFIGILSEYEDE